MKNVSSPLLALLAGLLSFSLLLSVSAAPSGHLSVRTTDENTFGHVGEKIKTVWSAIELWIYRLLHGGRYPPSYGSSPSSLSSVFSSTKTSISSSSTSSIRSTSSAAPTSSAVVSSAVASSSSVSSAAPASTSSAAAPSPSGSLVGQSVCAVQPPSFYAPSCSLTTDDTCCFTEQGHILQTYFWDTGSQSTGLNNSWTIHGLWPDECSGSYQAYCDPSREVDSVTAVLEQYGQDELLEYMRINWPDYKGDDDDFWNHEYNKHGTCMSSLEPSCYTNYYKNAEVVSYFTRSVEIDRTLSPHAWLAEVGIVPSLTKTYTLAEIESLLEAKHGGGVNVNCKSGVLNELWFHYNSRGSIIDGDFVPAESVGSGSTCPATGIKYYPKYVDIPTPGGGSAGGGSAAGKGFIYAANADGSIAPKTCLISGGAWYYGGTCAGYTIGAVTGGAVTLKSSKGLCAVDAAGIFGCSAAVTQASEFVMAADGTLNLGGSMAFSADHVPSGNEQVPVYRGASQTLPLTLKYVAQ